MNKLYQIGNDRDAGNELVLRHHYTARVPANVQQMFTWHEAGGLFGDTGEAVAACFFSIPPTRWSAEVWELSRLVRSPRCLEPLSRFLREVSRELRRLKACPLLVSFADQQHGHHGGIYRAAGWRLHAFRPPRLEGLTVNGVFVPGRSCNSRWGTQSAALLASRFPAWRIEPKFDEGKWCYWKSLNRHGKARARALGLRGLGFNGEPWPHQGQGSGSIPEDRSVIPYGDTEGTAEANAVALVKLA